MEKVVVIHSVISEQEEIALLEKVKAKGIKHKKEAIRLAIQHFINCDIQEPDEFYEKLKKKMKNK